MRKIFVPILGIASLLSLPTLALAANGAADGNGSASQSPNVTPATTGQVQQQLDHTLQQAGYTDIQIIPGSFLVRAKDTHGNPVEMMISPNSVAEVTALPASGTGQNGQSTMGRQDSTNQSATRQ